MKFGKSNGCVNEKIKQCSDKSTQICSGHTSEEMYVYVPANLPATCPTSTPDIRQPTPTFKLPTPSMTPVTTPDTPMKPMIKCGDVNYKLMKLGCWSEGKDDSMPKALPELILTARDTKSSVFAGYQIDTSNYAQFLNRYVKYYELF